MYGEEGITNGCALHKVGNICEHQGFSIYFAWLLKGKVWPSESKYLLSLKIRKLDYTHRIVPNSQSKIARELSY